MKQIRFAVIGTSAITERFLAAAENCPEFVLTAVYSRDRKRAETFGAAYNIKKYYDSLTELAEDHEVDAVYIASPNSLHCEQAILMMNAGKHVLCEKPLASNLVETERMQETAAQNQVVLLEAMRSIHDPGFLSIKEQLHKLGKLRYAGFQFCQYSSKYDAFQAGTACNIFNKTFSTGALMDIGIYCVEAMVTLFGEPAEVKAAGTFLKGDIDGAGTILAKYDEMIVELTYSKITGSKLPSQIQGEKGVMYISEIGNPRELKIVLNSGEEEVIVTENCDNNMCYEIRNFIQAVSEQKGVGEFAQITRTSLKITDTVRQQTGLRFPADMEV